MDALIWYAAILLLIVTLGGWWSERGENVPTREDWEGGDEEL